MTGAPGSPSSGPARPTETLAARMGPLASLPLFFKPAGRRVAVAGDSDGAGWKAELVAAAGATVDIYAPDPPQAMLRLARELPERVRLHRRAWTPEDLAGAMLAIGDFPDEDEARRFAAAARAAGAPVNCVDRPALCDFQFGSIVNRSPLVVGISTDGAAPVFGQAVRARIETLLPQSFQRWAEAARRWRAEVTARGWPFRLRRRFWERFTAMAFAAPGRAPDDAVRDRLFAAAEDDAAEAAAGVVHLVGAGPGDPELLTLRAVRLLQSADVILHDDLIPQAALDYARREAQLIHVGKRGHKPSCTQQDINALLVELAGKGLQVVRLKGGDPAIFGRAGEEIAALAAAGVACEVTPGVTAASGAAARLGVSLTHRDAARRLQFITAHARDGALPEDLDWRALADPAATTVVYMGLATLGQLAQRLVEAGLDPGTPALLAERATCPDERVIRADIATLPQKARAMAARGPALVIIGQAAGLGAG
ncbi:siroheme synthase CysG [Camelimonas abortus]|uniref:siroheme synthase CysG n=1 Tax=Camelimonas abortus TaxID=1017184 RepID=UPI0035E56658